MTVSDSSNTLIIETENRQEKGLKAIDLTIAINVPTDYTRSIFEPVERVQSFTIELTDPCTATLLNDFASEDVTISVLDGVV